MRGADALAERLDLGWPAASGREAKIRVSAPASVGEALPPTESQTRPVPVRDAALDTTAAGERRSRLASWWIG
jgi:hypothetical protein